jgi:hypothetical protein
MRSFLLLAVYARGIGSENVYRPQSNVFAVNFMCFDCISCAVRISLPRLRDGISEVFGTGVCFKTKAPILTPLAAFISVIGQGFVTP